MAGLLLVATAGAAAASEDEQLGRRLFLLHCAECHGESGDGYGPRENITYARPRSFLTGRFKLTTTRNRVPSDPDLERTIREGMPGTGMPSWSQLEEEEIRALARYVRRIGADALRAELDELVASGEISDQEAEGRFAERTVPGPAIEVPPEPEPSEQGLRRGREIYAESCAPCHGARGDAPEGSLKTDLEGNWLLPTSLAKGLFKGGGDDRQLFSRILHGLDGTAMPGFEGAYSDEELWRLVHYVRGLSAGTLPEELLLDPEPAAAASESSTSAAGEGGGRLELEDVPERPATPRLDLLIAVGVAVAGTLYLFAILRPRPRSKGPDGPRRVDP